MYMHVTGAAGDLYRKAIMCNHILCYISPQFSPVFLRNFFLTFFVSVFLTIFFTLNQMVASCMMFANHLLDWYVFFFLSWVCILNSIGFVCSFYSLLCSSLPSFVSPSCWLALYTYKWNERTVHIHICFHTVHLWLLSGFLDWNNFIVQVYHRYTFSFFWRARKWIRKVNHVSEVFFSAT